MAALSFKDDILGIADKWMPGDNTWYFVAYAGVAKTPIVNNLMNFGVSFMFGGGPATLRLGGLAVIEGITKEEAAEVCASDFFPAL